MSVKTSRSKSTVLSILKPSQFGTQRTSVHKVRFRLPSNVRQILLDFKNGEKRKEYDQLICSLRDADISDDELTKLLAEAKHCISLLNYDLRLFVQVLLVLNWTTRNDDVIELYKEVMHDIVSAHAHHTKIIVEQLVKLFLSPADEDKVEEWPDGVPTEICKRQYDNVHYLLRSILLTRPLSEDILCKSISHSFPYYKIKLVKQVSYFYNLLHISTYKPELRSDVLQLIIDKLIVLDANASREEIQMVEEEQCDVDMFAMEVDEVKTSTNMKHPIGNVLDAVMKILFTYVKNQCYEKDVLNWQKTRKLYDEFLLIFGNSLLATHALHHVQFLMFYLTSFKNVLAIGFLNFLWKKVTSPVCPSIIRKNSVAYLVSYLARANFVSSGCCKQFLNEMSLWIQSYITRNEGGDAASLDFSHHSVFYAVCQALFYLIAFRHKDLVDSRKKLTFLQSLNLSKIVTCQLNPLKVCQKAVMQNFAAVTRAYQLVYCYTVIEKNSRSCIPVLSRGRGSGTVITSQSLEMYFPFDPYVLLRTNCIIQPLYREYEASVTTEEHEDAVSTEQVDRLENETDEDDFIPEPSTGVQIKNNSHNFTYGTSPGFKQVNMSL